MSELFEKMAKELIAGNEVMQMPMGRMLPMHHKRQRLSYKAYFESYNPQNSLHFRIL